MIKTLASFGIAACACAISSLQAAPDTASVDAPKPAAKHVVKRSTSPKVATHYITTVSATGSHLPLVVCRYDGHTYSQSPFAAYTAPQLDQTGQLNVGAQLAQRDPAISSSTSRR